MKDKTEKPEKPQKEKKPKKPKKPKKVRTAKESIALVLSVCSLVCAVCAVFLLIFVSANGLPAAIFGGCAVLVGLGKFLVGKGGALFAVVGIIAGFLTILSYLAAAALASMS